MVHKYSSSCDRATIVRMKKRPPRTAFNPLSVEYFAALIDMGTITLKVNKNGYTLIPCVQITSTNFRLLDDIVSAFGGALSATQRSKHDGRKPSRYWFVHGGDAKRVLRDVLPHLRLKRRHALCVLSVPEQGNARGRSHVLTSHERDARRVLLERIRTLNNYHTRAYTR